jgi:hypothetical protein
MRDRLIAEGERIKTEELIVDYDNGGGQAGIRENPFYPAYEKLLKSYTQTLTVLNDMEGGRIQSDLPSIDEFRKKFKVAK